MACVRSMEIKASACRYDNYYTDCLHSHTILLVLFHQRNNNFIDGCAFCCSNCHECISWPHSARVLFPWS